MEYTQDVIDFWKKDNLNNITAGRKEFPEGWDVRPVVREIIGNDSIIEVGCGYGRLAPAFDAQQYVGVDISSTAITQAKQKLPTHEFRLVNVDDVLESSTWLMFYTVLLHVSDKDIEPYLRHVTANADKVLVAEILGRKWRTWKYVFNRELPEYDVLFETCGFKRVQTSERPYEHYKNTNITFITFEKNNA